MGGGVFIDAPYREWKTMVDSSILKTYIVLISKPFRKESLSHKLLRSDIFFKYTKNVKFVF